VVKSLTVIFLNAFLMGGCLRSILTLGMLMLLTTDYLVGFLRVGLRMIKIDSSTL